MKSNIFIPQKINVGFRERSDTYTKKLAYIIYTDEKGKLRKEASWNSWRDKQFESQEFENVPFEGFVLNKKVGDYSSGWDHRKAYVRVYDPREFEFEIDVTNLLYILENTSSIKGKGLEGEFVYGWDGKELVLIPTSSPDYVEIQKYNKLVHSEVKLKGKDLKLGGTYLTKQNEEWIYLGRYDMWDTKSDYNRNNGRYENKRDINKGKYYWFYDKDSTWKWRNLQYIKTLSNKIIGVLDEESVGNYADLIDELESSNYYSPVDDSKDEYLPYTLEEIEGLYNNYDNGFDIYDENKQPLRLTRSWGSEKEKGNYYIEETYYEEGASYWNTTRQVERRRKIFFTNGIEIYEQYKPHYKNKYLVNGKLHSEGKLNDK